MASYYFSNPAVGQGISNLAELIAGDPLQDIRAGLLGAQRRSAELEAERLGFGNQAIQSQAEMLRGGTMTPNDLYADAWLAGDDWLRYAPDTLLGYTAAGGEADDDLLTDLQTGAGLSYGNTIGGTREGFDNAITRAHIAAGPGYARVAEDARQFDEGLVNVRVLNPDGSESIIALPHSEAGGYEGQAGVADEFDPNALLEAGEGPGLYITHSSDGTPYVAGEDGAAVDMLPVDLVTDSMVGDVFLGGTGEEPESRVDPQVAEEDIRDHLLGVLGDEVADLSPEQFNRLQDVATRLYAGDEGMTIARASDLAMQLARISEENGGLPIALSPNDRPGSGAYVAPDGSIRQVGGQ